MSETTNKNLGHVTAYAYAKSKGYTGTEEEFAELMASYASTAETAIAAMEAAEAWATGGSGGTPTETNNAEYYAGVAEEAARTLTIDPTLSHEGQAADAEAVREALTYIPIAISSFSVSSPSSGLAELGSTVSSVSMAYACNKAPDELTLDEEDQTPAQSGTISLTGQTITQSHTYTLAASDDGSPIHDPATASKTAALSFVNRVCYGAAASGTVDSAFVNALANKVLSGSKARTFTVNAGSGAYIWYAVPKRLGSCTFKVGGFDGGFEAAQTVSVTNASGYTEDYYVYRSTNAGLGSTTVTVA